MLYMERLLPFMAQVWMCLTVMGADLSLKMKMIFHFRNPNSFFDEAFCAITAKQHSFWSLVFKWKVQNVAARLE